ncbi:MAG: FAD binding domain-containing protein [Anaerolineae bacterium]|nr:FAD binding domain-containing protein [Anaerolineae bacterium]
MANPQTYLRPSTFDELLAVIGQPGSLVLAGGGLMLGKLDVPYHTIIDLQGIAELQETEATTQGFRIGSAVTLSEVAALPNLHPAVHEAITRVIPLNVRNNLSVMESFMHPDHPMLSEWLAALVALDAGTHWLTPQRERQSFRMAELLMHEEAGSGLPGTLLQLDLRQPATGNEALGAAHVARTPADEPLVNATAYVVVDDDARVELCRVAVGGVDYTGIVLVDLPSLAGQPFDAPNIASAVKHVAVQIDPVADWRASADYRREMARICVQRALEVCLEQFEQRGS